MHAAAPAYCQRPSGASRQFALLWEVREPHRGPRSLPTQKVKRRSTYRVAFKPLVYRYRYCPSCRVEWAPEAESCRRCTRWLGPEPLGRTDWQVVLFGARPPKSIKMYSVPAELRRQDSHSACAAKAIDRHRTQVFV